MAAYWNRLSLGSRAFVVIVPALLVIGAVLTVGIALLLPPVLDFLGANVPLVRFVAAATNRTRGTFAPRKSSTGGSSRAIPTVSTAPITSRAGTITTNALEPSERRFQ